MRIKPVRIVGISLLVMSSVVALNMPVGAAEDPFVLMRRGENLARCGEYEQALELLNRASKLKPGDGSISYERGKLLYRMERYKEAVADFTVTIKSSQSPMPGTLFRRAQAYKRLKQYERAIADLSEAVKAETRAKKIADMILARAEVYLGMHQLKKAADDYSAYLSLDPTSQRRGEVLSLRAKAYEKLGDLGKAKRDREAARSLGFSG